MRQFSFDLQTAYDAFYKVRLRARRRRMLAEDHGPAGRLIRAQFLKERKKK